VDSLTCYDANMNDLEKILIEHPNFEWVDGMLGVSPTPTDYGYFIRVPGKEMRTIPHIFPLLDDPATKGGMLHLLRKAYGIPVTTEYDTINSVWVVWGGEKVLGYARTEGEALAVALVQFDE